MCVCVGCKSASVFFQAHCFVHVQCLLKQLRRHGGYCENVHWVRVNKIASGGFGTCFSILDNESNYLLAMKEVRELISFMSNVPSARTYKGHIEK